MNVLKDKLNVLDLKIRTFTNDMVITSYLNSGDHPLMKKPIITNEVPYIENKIYLSIDQEHIIKGLYLFFLYKHAISLPSIMTLNEFLVRMEHVRKELSHDVSQNALTKTDDIIYIFREIWKKATYEDLLCVRDESRKKYLRYCNCGFINNGNLNLFMPKDWFHVISRTKAGYDTLNDFLRDGILKQGSRSEFTLTYNDFRSRVTNLVKSHVLDNLEIPKTSNVTLKKEGSVIDPIIKKKGTNVYPLFAMIAYVNYIKELSNQQRKDITLINAYNVTCNNILFGKIKQLRKKCSKRTAEKLTHQIFEDYCNNYYEYVKCESSNRYECITKNPDPNPDYRDATKFYESLYCPSFLPNLSPILILWRGLFGNNLPVFFGTNSDNYNMKNGSKYFNSIESCFDEETKEEKEDNSGYCMMDNSPYGFYIFPGIIRFPSSVSKLETDSDGYLRCLLPPTYKDVILEHFSSVCFLFETHKYVIQTDDDAWSEINSYISYIELVANLEKTKQEKKSGVKEEKVTLFDVPSEKKISFGETKFTGKAGILKGTLQKISNSGLFNVVFPETEIYYYDEEKEYLLTEKTETQFHNAYSITGTCNKYYPFLMLYLYIRTMNPNVLKDSHSEDDFSDIQNKYRDAYNIFNTTHELDNFFVSIGGIWDTYINMNNVAFYEKYKYGVLLPTDRENKLTVSENQCRYLFPKDW